MDKLWKGLFYCQLQLGLLFQQLTTMSGYWMSDKPLVQQALANDLAELLLLIKPKDEAERLTAALDFLEGFWRAIIREWQGIDRIRCGLIPYFSLPSMLKFVVVGWTSSTS